jgi:hypothetical protein
MPFQGRVEIHKERFPGKGKICGILIENGNWGRIGKIRDLARAFEIEKWASNGLY